MEGRRDPRRDLKGQRAQLEEMVLDHSLQIVRRTRRFSNFYAAGYSAMAVFSAYTLFSAVQDDRWVAVIAFCMLVFSSFVVGRAVHRSQEANKVVEQLEAEKEKLYANN